MHAPIPTIEIPVRPSPTPTSVPTPIPVPPTKKKFEVEDVVEIDSPSDTSATSSTENLEKELKGETITTNETGQLRKAVQLVPGGLESGSESSMVSMQGLEFTGAALDPRPASSADLYQPSTTTPEVENAFRQRSSSTPFVSSLQGAIPVVIPGIQEAGLGYFRHSTSSMPMYPATSSAILREPTPPQQLPQHDAPYHNLQPHHTDLLTEAFGRFLHSMSSIIRDPTMQPLLQYLDHQFGSEKQTQTPPRQYTPPATEAVTPPTKGNSSGVTSSPPAQVRAVFILFSSK